jgi:uncharacterized membrane protein YdjX (TVP38/TMEM64 family)
LKNNNIKNFLYKFKIIINILVAIIVFVTLIYTSIKFTPDFVEIVKNSEEFREFLLSYGNLGYFIFIFFQIIHIVIPAIPGEVVQIAGGYVYGVTTGTLLLYLGMIIGSIIAFYTSRIVGYSLVKVFVGKEKIIKFKNITNSKKSNLILFIIFLIPGIPKDIVIYVMGLTPIKSWRLILISTTARMPGVIGSAYIGANIMSKNYKVAITMGIISLILFMMGIVFRKKVFSMVNSD